MGWHEFKQWLEVSSGLDMDALHVHAGVVFQLIAVLLLRRPLKSVLPWLAVLIGAALNEGYDLWVDAWPSRGMQWVEGAKDLMNTMLVPTLLLAVAKWAPRLFVGAPAPAAQDRPER